MAKRDKRKLVVGQRQSVEGIVRRDFSDVDAVIDVEKRQVQMSFSSEAPYKRESFWTDPWIETLGHDADEIDLKRLNDRASVDWNHSRAREDRLGWVLEASLDKKGKRTNALIQLSERDDIDDIWNDLQAGGIRNSSVLYRIHERVLTRAVDDGPDEFRVTSWEPMNLSLVDIPADPSVGVGRSAEGSGHFYRVIDLEPLLSRDGNTDNEDTEMAKKDEKNTETAKSEKGDTVAKSEVAGLIQTATAEAVSAALTGESKRQADIRASFAGQHQFAGIDEILTKCLDDQEITLADANDLLLKGIGEKKEPTGVGSYQPGIDSADKFRSAAIQSIEQRAGVMVEGKPMALDLENPMRGFSLVELARSCLQANNLPHTGSRAEIIGQAFTMRSAIGLTPSDFALILANVANKAVLIGFGEAEETWMTWCNVGNLSDFKAAKRVGLSQFEDLELVGPGGEYKYGKFVDKGETITLASYGKLFPIARQSIINDDLQVLTAIPQKMGRAAARVPGDLAYIALTSNPTMGDTIVLFDTATHKNIGVSGVISIASVEDAQTKMALQSDANNAQNGSNIELRFLLVPVQLKGTAITLARSEFDPASTTNSRAPNSVQGTFQVVSEARLSADSAAQWYGVASPVTNDTVEVAFLDGVQAPRVEEKAGWTVDGVEFKVGLDVAAAPMEYRSFIRNAGV